MSDELKQMGKTRKLLKPLMDLFADRIEKAASSIESSVTSLEAKVESNKEITTQQIIDKANEIRTEFYRVQEKQQQQHSEDIRKAHELFNKTVSDLSNKMSVTVKAPDLHPTFEVPKPEVIINKAESKDPGEYQPHDQGKKGMYQYSGFARADGAWYIQRVTKGEQRYAAGKDDYTDAWEKRDKLEYGLISEVM